MFAIRGVEDELTGRVALPRTVCVRVLRAALALGGSLLLALAAAAPNATAADRAYELVSPVDKGGSEVTVNSFGNFATLRVAPGGHSVAYASLGPFPISPGGTLVQQFVSTRGEAGWSTRGISPPVGSAGAGPTQFARTDFLSADLARAVVQTPLALTPGAADLAEAWGLYLRDDTVTPPAHTLLSVPTDPLPPGGNAFTFQVGAATPGLDRIVFNSRVQLLPGAPQSGLYEWADGELRVAGVLPNGEPADDANAGARPIGDGGRWPGDTPISDDGSRLYFTSGFRLYRRASGSETEIVSASEREGDDPDVAQPAQFLLATADGSKAFFASQFKLTDDATAFGSSCASGSCDLYRWDGDAEPGERLTDLTTQDPDGAGLIIDSTAIGTDDGSHVYFVARGELADGAEDGEPNLYLWRQGDGVRHVATLDEADRTVWGPNRNLNRDVRISEDGERLLFASHVQLTGHDNDGHRQVYLYEAADDEITCVSCSPLSEPSTADAALLLDSGNNVAPLVLPRNLSRDGTRAFFETADRLLPADTNGRIDVYQWEDGELELVSDGESARDSHFIGASESGDDVFFVTRAQLVGQDQDDLGDVYDARVGGGFPEPSPPQPCTGDDCQGPVSSPPGDSDPGSSGAAGPGNLADNRFGFGKARKNKRRGKARLTVRVPGPGELRLARNRGVKPAEKSARSRGRVRLSVNPTGKAKRKLRQKKRRLRKQGKNEAMAKVTVTARVTFSPDGGEPRTKTKRLRLVKR